MVTIYPIQSRIYRRLYVHGAAPVRGFTLKQAKKNHDH